MKRTASIAIVLAFGLSACASTSARAPSAIDPGNFVRVVDNPWFPLKTGSVWHYKGTKDGKPSIDLVRVTGATRQILGVTTTAVRDRLYLKGKLEERTT